MKRLIVCCDGTWNTANMPCPTNVVKIARAVKSVASDGIDQLVYYDEGVGTEWLNKWTGGAFGWGIDENIQQAYAFLAVNYEAGDEIYLFGFSRGAYTVRSLAGFIYCSGLVRPDKLDKVQEAYKIYRSRTIKPGNPIAEQFRQANGERVPITVLGCWDTVGALGIPDVVPFLPFIRKSNERYQFHDTELSAIIQNALHAVAVDEIRKSFNVTPMNRSQNPRAATQVVQQVWFPGEHGCVGGGTPAHMPLSNAALKWIVTAIADLGLKLEFEELDLAIDPTVDFDNQPRFPFNLAPVIQRDVNNGFEALHQSVAQRWQGRADYRPENLAIYQAQLDSASVMTA
ncbi:MAG TPA: DUF2235 domain-containing protein [Leptolyngbyaceae cyanobacterium M33_DOE_097]|uniref:DUF2235 domain-containing protein n=1 Tax=Oscillatoriales cyanobacterium SpSt-418 TaxID=2282169 RepID=A0A7C3PFN8_9CYAN|nr:DUF2235 domain-containing protein [Leptolyngbyaceae cyanobacterium M33_DOE_097]